MKSKKADLLANTTTVYGDLTKTFLTPMVTAKTVNLKSVIGPPRPIIIPVFDDFAVTPVSAYIGKNRIFVIGTVSAGLARVMLYDFDPVTNLASPVGSFNMQFPAGTTTIRQIVVDDGASSATVTGWKIFAGDINSTTASLGGVFMAGCAAAGIAKTDFTVVPATIPTATLADSKQVYKLENSPFTLTAIAGIMRQEGTTFLFGFNGTASTLTAAKFDYSLPTGAPGANGVITALTVFGGAGVTGTLPALTGTLLLTGSFCYAKPQHASYPVAVRNFDCVYFMTSSQTVLGRLDELTAGGVTWPSLNQANNIMPFSHINPTYAYGYFEPRCDREFTGFATSLAMMKLHANSSFEKFFGTNTQRYWESGSNTGIPAVNFAAITPTQFFGGLGWLGAVSTAGSQRGLVLIPTYADEYFMNEYFITKVIDVKYAKRIDLVSLIAQLREYRSGWKLEYRISGFASQTAGWLSVPNNYDMSAVLAGDQIQFRGIPRIFSEWYSGAMQVEELAVNYTSKYEMDEFFAGSDDFTDTGSPVKTGFSQIALLGTAHPAKYYFRAFSKATGSLLRERNTVDHAAEFKQTSNDGLTWVALGVLPDSLTSGLRYEWDTPPGEVIIAVLQRD